MTKTHYQSTDKIVEVLLTTDDNRFPRHSTPMVVLKLHPQPHTRCREQWGGITAMLNYADIRALLEAVTACNEGLALTLPETATIKPEARKKAWQQRNILRATKRWRRW